MNAPEVQSQQEQGDDDEDEDDDHFGHLHCHFTSYLIFMSSWRSKQNRNSFVYNHRSNDKLWKNAFIVTYNKSGVKVKM